MQVKVWDLPLRLFHWLLVISVGGAWLSAEMAEDFGAEALLVHGKIGLCTLGLLVFRLVWGFVGSTHSRFRDFFPTPNRIRSYLTGESYPVGHNPLGALSVFALLTLLMVQVGTGLFANDDISFQGPLFPLISQALSNLLTKIHHATSNALLLLITVHLVAIGFYLRIKKNDLVKPMITGYKDAPQHLAARGGGVFAFLFAAATAALVIYLASGSLLAHPSAVVQSW